MLIDSQAYLNKNNFKRKFKKKSNYLNSCEICLDRISSARRGPRLAPTVNNVQPGLLLPCFMLWG